MIPLALNLVWTWSLRACVLYCMHSHRFVWPFQNQLYNHDHSRCRSSRGISDSYTQYIDQSVNDLHSILVPLSSCSWYDFKKGGLLIVVVASEYTVARTTLAFPRRSDRCCYNPRRTSWLMVSWEIKTHNDWRRVDEVPSSRLLIGLRRAYGIPTTTHNCNRPYRQMQHSITHASFRAVLKRWWVTGIPCIP